MILLQNNAFQDLCYNYTWPLLLMLFGAWILGTLLSYLWWARERARLERHSSSLQSKLGAADKKISDQQSEYDDLAFAKRKLDEDYALLRSRFHSLQASDNQPKEPFNSEKEDQDFSFFEPEEEEVVPEHVEEVVAGEREINYSEPEEDKDQALEEEEFFGEDEEGHLFDEEVIKSYPNTDHTVLDGASKAFSHFQLQEGQGKLDHLFSYLPATQLKIIAGVGKKMEKLLKSYGIQTWAELSGVSPQQLRRMLEEKGKKYSRHDPSSWPEQARLAAEADWENLILLQGNLGRGPRRKDKHQTAKVERFALQHLGFSNDENDLKVISGIGQKTEALLKAADYESWQDLANAKIAELRRVLLMGGSYFQNHDPSTWPTQAKLALAKNWLQLKRLQDEMES